MEVSPKEQKIYEELAKTLVTPERYGKLAVQQSVEQLKLAA